MSSIRVAAVERRSVQTLKTLEFSMIRSGGVKGVFLRTSYEWSDGFSFFFGQPLINTSEAIWQMLRNVILLSLCVTRVEYSL